LLARIVIGHPDVTQVSPPMTPQVFSLLRSNDVAYVNNLSKMPANQ